MPFLIAIAAAVVRIIRKPLDVRLKRRRIGPLALAAVGVVLGLIWDRSGPDGLPALYLAGDIAGVLAVYLMVVALVLATRLAWIEPWFGGLDQMYRWHRCAGLWSIPLVAGHVFGTQIMRHETSGVHVANPPAEVLGIVSGVLILVLVAVSLPRIGRIVRLRYDRWVLSHRLTGVFVMTALLHGWWLDPVIESSWLARSVFVGVSSVGVVAYVHDELIRRRVESASPYEVRTVHRVSSDIIDVQLSPIGPAAALPVVAGQFVYLVAGDKRAFREHPFSVAGVAGDGSVRLTIRARGRDTRRLHAELREGMPATLLGPYGMFDFTVGGKHQVWVAGGIGIAPFLGWLSRLDGSDGSEGSEGAHGSGAAVHLFYTAPTENEMAFREELTDTARRLPEVDFHPHFSTEQGRLTVERIRETVGELDGDTHVFMCGPSAMVEDFRRDLVRGGVPREHIHSEHFAFR